MRICRYAWYTFDPCSCSETNWSYLLPLGKCSPAQGICKTAFLKHPRRFWLQKGHRAWLTEVFLPFQGIFLTPQMCAFAACSAALIFLLLHMIFRQLRQKTEGIDLVQLAICGKAAHFMIHEVLTVFLLSQPSKVSIFFCRENKLRCQPRKKKAPWYVTRKQFFLHLNSTLVSLVNTYWVVDLWEKMWLFKTPTCPMSISVNKSTSLLLIIYVN